MCRLRWIPWIPLFWMLATLVVQCSCFAICFPPHILHSNYLSNSSCLFWIRGTCQIMIMGTCSFFVGSSFRWWSHHIHCQWVDNFLTALSITIEVHWLMPNQDGSGRSHPAGRKMQSCTVHSFIDIGWYCWQSRLSWFLSTYNLLQINHLTCFLQVLTIFKKQSVKTYLNASWWRFRV